MAPLQLFYTVTDCTLADDFEDSDEADEVFELQPKQEEAMMKHIIKEKSHQIRQRSRSVNRDIGYSKRKHVPGKTEKRRKSSQTAFVRSQEILPKSVSPVSDKILRSTTSTKKVYAKTPRILSNTRKSNRNTQKGDKKKRVQTKHDIRTSALQKRRKVMKRKTPKRTDVPSLKGNESESEKSSTSNVKAMDIGKSAHSDLEGTHVLQSDTRVGEAVLTKDEVNTQLHGSQGKDADVSSATADCQSDKVTANIGDNVNNEQFVDCKSEASPDGQNSGNDQSCSSEECQLDNSSKSLGGTNETEATKTVEKQFPPTCHELSVLQAQKHDQVRQGKGKQPLKINMETKSVKQIPIKSLALQNSSNESDSDHQPMEICTDADDNSVASENIGEASNDIVQNLSKVDIKKAEDEDEKQVNLNLLADAATRSSKATEASPENMNTNTSIYNALSRDIHDVIKSSKVSSSSAFCRGKESKAKISESVGCQSETEGNLETKVVSETVPKTVISMCQQTQCLEKEKEQNKIVDQLKAITGTEMNLDSIKNNPSDAPGTSCPSTSVTCTTSEQGLVFRHTPVQVKSVEVQTEGTDVEKSSPILLSVFAKTGNYSADLKEKDTERKDILPEKTTMKVESKTAKTAIVGQTVVSGVSQHSDVSKMMGKQGLRCRKVDLKSNECKSDTVFPKQKNTKEFTNHDTKTGSLSNGNQHAKSMFPNTSETQVEEKFDGVRNNNSDPIYTNPSDCDRFGGEQSPSEGKKNPISFAKKYRCPTRHGKTENKLHSLKGDRNKMSRKSSTDNSDPYIFTADDNHNYVNGASPNSDDRHSPVGSTSRNALAFLEEYVNYVHSNQQSEELPKQPSLPNRVINQQAILSQTSQTKVEDSATGGHVILGTITLPRAYIPLKDIASAAAMQKRKSKSECANTLVTGAKPDIKESNIIADATKESEEDLKQGMTVDGKKIPPLKLKLRKSNQNASSNGNHKNSPTKKALPTKSSRSGKKVSASPQKPELINLNTEDDGHPRIFLRISKANIPSLNRSLSANDTSSVQLEDPGDTQTMTTPKPSENMCIESRLKVSQIQPVSGVATDSTDIISGENNTRAQPVASEINNMNDVNIEKVPNKEIKEASKVKCVQPAKIRSKIQRSMSLPHAIKAIDPSSTSSAATVSSDVQTLSHGMPVAYLPNGNNSNKSQHQEDKSTKSSTITATGDGKNSPMKGTRILKSSVTVVSTYNTPSNKSSNVSTTQMLAQHSDKTNVRGNHPVSDYQKVLQEPVSKCSGTVKPANAKQVNNKTSQQGGGIVFSVSPSSLLINANSTIPTVLSLSQIEALNQYLSSTNTAIAVSTGQIVTTKIQPPANTQPSQVITSPVASELASTSQIVQMLLSTPPITTAISTTQTCIAQQSNTGSKASLNFATVGNIARIGNTPHFISFQGGRQISPINVTQQQPSVNKLSIPAASLKLPLPVKRKLPTINPVGPAKIIRLPVQARLSISDSQKNAASSVPATIASQSTNVMSLTRNITTVELPQSANSQIVASTANGSSVLTNVSAVVGEGRVTSNRPGTVEDTVVTVSPCDVTILGKVEQLSKTSPICPNRSVIRSSPPCKTTTATLPSSQYFTLLPKSTSQTVSGCPGHLPNFNLLNSMLTTAITTTGTLLTNPLNGITSKCPTTSSGVATSKSPGVSKRNKTNARNTQNLHDLMGIQYNTSYKSQSVDAKLCTGVTTLTTMSSVATTPLESQKISSNSIPSTSSACSINLISLLSGDNTKPNTSNGFNSMDTSSVNVPQLNRGPVQSNSGIPPSTSAYSNVLTQLKDKPVKGLLQTTSPTQLYSSTSKGNCHPNPVFTYPTESPMSSAINPTTAQNVAVPVTAITPSTCLSNSLMNNIQDSQKAPTAAPVVSAPLLPQVYLGARHCLPPHISYHGIVYPGSGIVMVNGQPRLMTSQQSAIVSNEQQVHCKLPVKRTHTGDVQASSVEHLPANGYDAPLELTTKKSNTLESPILEK